MSWNERWGFGGDMAEIERELGLLPGRYYSASTGEIVTLRDPQYPAQTHNFSISRLVDGATGHVWNLGLCEISNGIYAMIWRRADGGLE